MALRHLRESVTKQNLWLYILRILWEKPASPAEITRAVSQRYSFSPARITFYSVLYKLKREGLVEKMTESFRSRYRLTEKGRKSLEEGLTLLFSTGELLKTGLTQESAAETL